MFRRALVACVILLGLGGLRLRADDWQMAPVPALTPGALGEWDDFQVAAPTIVRGEEAWSMYYTGGRLDENGLSTAIGLATSADGVTWKKREAGAVLKGELGRGASPVPPRLQLASVCRRSDGNLVMLVRETEARRGDSIFRFHKSGDGVRWESWPEADAALKKTLGTALVLSCTLDCEQDKAGWMSVLCLVDDYDDPKKREFWRLLWLKSNKWSEPTKRPISEIVGDGAVQYVALASSGEYRLLFGLIEPAGREDARKGVIRVSRDLRSWRKQGPPEFAFPRDGGDQPWNALRVGMLAQDDGVRLFYEFYDLTGAMEIRSAFCPKTAFRSGP